MSPPSLSEVAREANVSKSTVSKVLNGYRDVSPATRELVESALIKLGVPRPDRTASSSVLLVLPDLRRPALLAVADQTFARQGYGLQLCTRASIENHPIFEAHSSRPERHYLGVITVDVTVPAELVRQIRDRGRTLVAVSDRVPSDAAAVRIEHHRAIKAAFMHLADHDHRHVSIEGQPDRRASDYRVELLTKTAGELGFDVTDRAHASSGIALSDAAIAAYWRESARRMDAPLREVIGVDTSVPVLPTISSPYADVLSAALARLAGGEREPDSEPSVITKLSRFRVHGPS